MTSSDTKDLRDVYLKLTQYNTIKHSGYMKKCKK